MGRRLVTKRNLAEWEKILDVEWNYLKSNLLIVIHLFM